MKTILKALGVVVALGVVILIGLRIYVGSAIAKLDAQTYEVHAYDFPIPAPLSEGEVEALRQERLQALEAAGEPTADEEGNPIDLLADVDLAAIAQERALERGRHLVQARYACIECHGKDLSGGVMVDDPAIGTWLGPNLTSGKGGVIADYTAADFDRIVRHGVKRDGTSAKMPSEDFMLMSDQELGDVITYLRSFPPVDNAVPTPTLGPIGSMLIITGKMKSSAETIHHDTPHVALPPPTEVSAEFGRHLANICTGCHRATLEGGPMPFGPPDWPPAGNLTPQGGVAGWTLEQFKEVMRTGKRPDGTMVQNPMSLIMPYANEMTEVELEALWAYISQLEPKPTGI